VDLRGKMTVENYTDISAGLMMADTTVMVVSFAVSFFNIHREANRISSDLSSFNCIRRRQMDPVWLSLRSRRSEYKRKLAHCAM